MSAWRALLSLVQLMPSPHPPSCPIDRAGAAAAAHPPLARTAVAVWADAALGVQPDRAQTGPPGGTRRAAA
eukprot:scaffold33222_cov129-Isochrysis_galbana.AAC.8